MVSGGLAGAPNSRCLGGLAGDGGRLTREGLLLRSSGLGALTAHDVSTLRTMGLRHVIDLRGPHEIATLGPDRLPPGPALVNLPVHDPDVTAFALVCAPPDGTPPGHWNRLLADGGAERAMIDLYRAFVALPSLRTAFADALALVADPAARPLLFHCTAGKDRTGWLAAILLTALGVPRADVLADYLRTNACLGPAVRGALETLCARQGVHDPALMAPLTVADPRYLAASFAEADRLYGSFDAYLYEGLGVDEAMVRGLRDTLLDVGR
ncbi:tyrosine-protein phosphatase [Streptomyces sp. 4F14]|uniref:tyrosine-protein phosphatase n=1 Tax=Streptomyces sp. 4F14 TaxID=3394380 RepID=UPI003A8604AE